MSETIDEETIKNVFKDSKTVHIEDHARNPYEYFMEGMMERADLEITKITEQLLFYDIIEIYKGRFKDYKDYYDYVVDYNNKCREHNNNPVKSGEYKYLFSYSPERRLLLDRHFEFIKNLNKELNEADNELIYKSKKYNLLIKGLDEYRLMVFRKWCESKNVEYEVEENE